MALELQEGLQMCADNMDSTNTFSLKDLGTEMALEGQLWTARSFGTGTTLFMIRSGY